MNKKEAIEELEWLADDGCNPVAVGIRTAAGELWYAARNMLEAQRWVNFNRDYMYPGSDTYLRRGEV